MLKPSQTTQIPLLSFIQHTSNQPHRYPPTSYLQPKKLTTHYRHHYYPPNFSLHLPTHAHHRARLTVGSALKVQGETQLSDQENRALFLFYVQYVCACLLERTWRFILPLMLATQPNSLRMVAQLQLYAQAIAIALGPVLGHALDTIRRDYILFISSSFQCLSIILTCHFILPLLWAPGASFATSWQFYMLCALNIVERLSANMYDVSIERDWVVDLVGPNRPQQLTQHNSIIRRLDQLSSLAGVILIGGVMSTLGDSKSALATIKFNLMLLPIELLSIWGITKVSPNLIAQVQRAESTTAPNGEKATNIVLARAQSSRFGRLSTMLKPLKRMAAGYFKQWKLFFQQRSTLPTLAYTLLFFNIILCTSQIITAYLAQVGMSSVSVMVFQFGASFCGFLGSTLSVWFVQRFGLMRSGAIAFVSYATLVASAGMVYNLYMSQLPNHPRVEQVITLMAHGLGMQAWLTNIIHFFKEFSATLFSEKPQLWYFAGFVIVSRGFMWMLDVFIAQINQEMVPRNQIKQVSAIEQSITSITDMSTQFILAVCSSPVTFPFLLNFSWLAVVCAAVIYMVWWGRQEQVQALEVVRMLFRGKQGIRAVGESS